ncbi:MAG TPA: hypothetical protein VF411_10440, partial [Bacteroidia bacterium]
MKTITHTVAAFIATTMLATNVQAQQNPNYVAAKDSTTTPPPTRDHPDRMKSLITGDAFFGYKFVNNRGLNKANQSTFTTLAVNPVWLWKLTDKLSFEGETEFQSSLWQEDPTATSGMAVGAGLAVELETCNLQYKINPYMMLKVGEFFTPYGVAEDWYHQRITDRMIDRPIGIGHGGIEAGSDMGACLQGGVPLPFGAKLHYAAALLQGQKLISDGQQVLSNGVKFNNNGALDIENIIAHTTAKTWVARVGYLPVPWFEIGGWYGSGKVNADNDKLNTGNVMAVHLGGYLSIIKTMPAIKGTVILRSQYSQQNIGDAVFANTSGVGTYTFSNNNSSAYYVQASYRPVLAGKVLGMFELAARYGQMTLPDQAQKQWILPGSTQGPNPYQSKSQVAVS